MRSHVLKQTLIASVAFLTVMAGSQALAQPAVIEVAPEQRTVIREYVVKKKVRPVTIKSKVVVGSPLPADVEIVEVPSEWGPAFRKYRYVYWDDRVVLVNPSDRRVVHIID